MRGGDGSPAIRLGDGYAFALSPDGAWAATFVPPHTQQLVLLPTGAGEPRPLPRVGIQHQTASWFPDGKQLLVVANAPGRPARSWIEDLEGHVTPITPENEWCSFLTADGKQCISNYPGDSVKLYPIGGGPPAVLSQIDRSLLVCGVSSDGRSFFLAPRARHRGLPVAVSRLDLASGRVEPWRELQAPDAVGEQGIDTIRLSGDGATVAFSFRRFVSDLYLVEGL